LAEGREIGRKRTLRNEGTLVVCLSQSAIRSDSESVLVGIAQGLLCAIPESVFLMINSYSLHCDASGGHDHGFIVVAGYLSTFEKWLVFMKEWNILLGTYNVPYFHMMEFAQSKGPFTTWKGDEPRRVAFLSKAAGIIREHVERSYATLVEYDGFSKIAARYPLKEIAGNPYSLAARTCAARASEYIHDPTMDVAYIFEDGDEGKGELLRVMHRDGYSAPIFRPSRNQVINGKAVKGLVTLQAADFAAYELRKVFRDDPNCERWPIERYRKSLAVLAEIPGELADWGHYGELELVEMCKKINAKRQGK
jgi:hypothetical protein